jgi:hypothetical protein
MEPAERSLITLTHNAGWLLIAISEQVRTAEISDEMRETVEHLVKYVCSAYSHDTRLTIAFVYSGT